MQQIQLEKFFLPVKNQFALTKREYEVLVHMVKGQTSCEIADQLSIKERSVLKYSGSLLKKMNLNRRTDLAYWLLNRYVLNKTNENQEIS